MQTRKRTEDLPVQLTQDEVRQRGERLAQLLADKRGVERELSAAKTRAKGKTEAIDAEAMKLEEEIRERAERRPVEVVDQLDVEAKVINRVRLDTGEVIFTRPAKFDELQPDLPLDPETPGDAAEEPFWDISEDREGGAS